MIRYMRAASLFASICLSDCNANSYIHIFAYHCLSINYYRSIMTKIKAFSYFRFRRDLDMRNV